MRQERWFVQSLTQGKFHIQLSHHYQYQRKTLKISATMRVVRVTVNMC